MLCLSCEGSETLTSAKRIAAQLAQLYVVRLISTGAGMPSCRIFFKTNEELIAFCGVRRARVVISTRIHPGVLVVAALAALTGFLILSQSVDHRPNSAIIASQPPPSLPKVSAKPLSGIARVIDGDTIVIQGTHIRLSGIDAPESKQSCEASGRAYQCGEQATEALIRLLAGQPTECTEVTKDRYQRIVARCQVGSIDIGGWMVEHGWAIAYRKYSTEYVKAEQNARNEKAGIWAGTFLRPQDWRRNKAMERLHVRQ